MITLQKRHGWMRAGFVELVLAESAMRSLMLSPVRRARILAALFVEAARMRSA